MIFNTTVEHIRGLAKLETSPLYYLESKDTIVLFKRMDGFIFKAEYPKVGDENDTIWAENNLGDATRVLAAIDDNMLGMTLLKGILDQLIAIQATLADSNLPADSLLEDVFSSED